ncbi:MAG: prepilin-type N-terminal cleavage/methylation domain-containing protein [Pseudoscardovia radai]|nr:prepilin-type N-terminal cleavage/methylation domain-containing protein [Pseudoscardovia radai]
MNPVIRALRRRAKGEKGFTLTEIMVVIVVAAILAAIAIPLWRKQRAGTYNSQTEQAVSEAVIAVTDYAQAHDDSAAGLSGVTCDYPLGGTAPTCKIANKTVDVSEGVHLTLSVDAAGAWKITATNDHASGNSAVKHSYTYSSTSKSYEWTA